MPGPWALTTSTIGMQLRSLRNKAYCACVPSRADRPDALHNEADTDAYRTPVLTHTPYPLEG